MAEFRWTPETIEAAQLLAAGNLAISEIADKFGVRRETVWAWRQHPDFKARVDEELEKIRAEVRRVGIADAMARVRRLNDRANRMSRLMEARADDPTMAEVPGGNTGLLVRTIKSVGSGDNATIVEEYSVDTGLLREMREHEKQAAQELGQWAEKHQISGPNDGPLAVIFEQATDRVWGESEAESEEAAE